MALSPAEQQILENHEDDFKSYLDSATQASWDFRLDIIANYLIDGTPDPEGRNYGAMCQQIAGDYELDVEGIVRALQLNESRRPLGEA